MRSFVSVDYRGPNSRYRDYAKVRKLSFYNYHGWNPSKKKSSMNIKCWRKFWWDVDLCIVLSVGCKRERNENYIIRNLGNTLTRVSKLVSSRKDRRTLCVSRCDVLGGYLTCAVTWLRTYNLNLISANTLGVESAINAYVKIHWYVSFSCISAKLHFTYFKSRRPQKF